MEYPTYAKYSYSGPVKEFDRIISDKWSGSTFAVSEKKARSNLIFKFKKQFGKIPASKISLPGKVILESEVMAN